MTVRTWFGRHVEFAEPPCAGFRLTLEYLNGRRKRYRLIFAEPYRRAGDGAASAILHWRDERGDWFTSGLSSAGMSRKRRPPRLLRAALALP